MITGASGLLGTHLVLEAMDNVEIIAISHRMALAPEGIHTVQMDLVQPENAYKLLEDYAPDWIVNCAALTDVDACEEDPEGARALNRDLPARLARASTSRGTKFVHISTDAVFDGKSGDYEESAIPAPVNEYGLSKLEGEKEVLVNNPRALVLRTNFFGWSPGSRTGLFEWFYWGLEAGELRQGFNDVLVSLLSAHHLATWIMRLLRSNYYGLYHLSSSDCMSKYQFGRLIAETFSFSTDLIQPVSVDEARFRAKRPKNLCLSTRKLSQETRSELPTIHEGIRLLQDYTQNGFREKQKALFL
jgi:dTDP-4-dehydrorhamnose reductase